MKRFRFESLEIWQEASRIGDKLDDIADELSETRKYRYAEQLRAAALSVSNNIAEGSGSDSTTDFRNFLNIARRSIFENANMLLMFQRKAAISQDRAEILLEAHRVLSAKIAAFRNSLR